jgi:hypothetical protein
VTNRPSLVSPVAGLSLFIACASGPASVLPDLPPEASPEQIAAFSATTDSVAGDRLAELLARETDRPLRIVLEPGHYWLSANPWTDPTCGNCEDPNRTVEGTAGLVLSGSGLELVGSRDRADDVVIHTRAGHGIVFDGCESCILRGLTITDGVRDTVGETTNAGVLVRESDVHLDSVVIRDNLGDSAVVARTISGVMGVAVREGGQLLMTDSRIIRNSWDGVAMYREARGTLRNNVVDGVDAATGARLGGGRGVGIGLTWNARAVVEGNLVRGYWKGIGVFVDAQGEIRENIVEDVLTWGIVLWDADKGTPRALVERNAVSNTGACGINVHDSGEADPEPGFVRQNIVVRTGQNPRYDSGEPYCEQTAIATPHLPAGFDISDNALGSNREPEDGPGRGDQEAAEFDALSAPVFGALRLRPALRGSAFLLRGDH